MDRVLLSWFYMTTCEWIYLQTSLTDLALDHAHTPDDQEFVMKRLRELQGRVQFEERRLARIAASFPESRSGNSDVIVPFRSL
jgi:hypothetical protein